jgi:hypothetical protein
VQTPDDDAVAAGHGVDPARWRELFDELMFLVAGRFGRAERRLMPVRRAHVHDGSAIAATTKATPAAATTSADSPPNSAHNEVTLPY